MNVATLVPAPRRTVGLMTLGVVASLVMMLAPERAAKRPTHRRSKLVPHYGCVERVQHHRPSDSSKAQLAELGLQPILLERRWLNAMSPEEATAALGSDVAPWQQFLYTGDSQPRSAFASEVYASNAPQPRHETAQDRFGGVWLVKRPTVPAAATVAGAPVTYTRDVWLLPPSSAFRGIIDGDHVLALP